MGQPLPLENHRLDELLDAVIDYSNHFYLDGSAQLPPESLSACKVGEESGELLGAIAKSWPQFKREDEFGDILFSALHHALICNYDIHGAIARAIAKAKYRQKTSRVLNGIIVKEEDLPEGFLEEESRRYLDTVQVIGMG